MAERVNKNVDWLVDDTGQVTGYQRFPGDKQALVSGAGSLGPLADTTALNSTYPAASNAGKSALIGASAPYATYDCNGSVWSPRVGGGSANFVDAEVPTGTKNGINLAFTLANSPSPAGSLCLFVNGQLMRGGGVDFTLTGAAVAMAALAPSASDVFVAFYRF